MHCFMQYATVLVKLLPSESDSWELLGSQFSAGTKLGEGNYGVVYKGALSTDVSTAPAVRHMDKMEQEGKSPYTVAIKILKGESAGQVNGRMYYCPIQCLRVCNNYLYTIICILPHPC